MCFHFFKLPLCFGRNFLAILINEIADHSAPNPVLAAVNRLCDSSAVLFSESFLERKRLIDSSIPLIGSLDQPVYSFEVL